MIRLSKEYCPESRMEIVTNGDCLTLKRMQSIFEAGLDTVLISLYDGPHQIDHFKALSEEAGLREDQMVLRQRFTLDDFNLTNRCGLVDEDITEPIKLPLEKKCFLPSYTI